MDENKIIYIYSKRDEETLNKKLVVENALMHEGFSITVDDKEAHIIISLGSDGAFLQAVQKTGFRQDCFYAGISVKEKHGLYCDFYYNNLPEMINAIQSTELDVRSYPLIEVKIDNHCPFYCLNEFSIRSTIIKTLVSDITIDDNYFETFRGDGLIISTPSGSTAYNKSVGGAVVDPQIKCFQVTELASVNTNEYRTLGSSFVLGGERKLQLHLHQDGNHFPSMASDNEAFGIRKVEKIDIELSQKTINTIKLKNNSFWEKVQRIFL